MTIQLSEEWILWSRKTKALGAGLLMAAMMAASLLAGATQPAQAADTFTVDQTVDTPDANVGDGDCDVSLSATGFQCTLRAAIQEANATPGADMIRFFIQDAGGTGVKTLKPTSPLPAITEQVTIDGYTQPGAKANTKAVGNDAILKIELVGTNAGNTNGLLIDGPGSGGSVIKGLVINRFLGSGIQITGDSVVNRIEGNFIGTDATGTLGRGNGSSGVNITGGPSENIVGGVSPAARNVISGNDFAGVFVSGSNINEVQGNYIGTDKSGTKDLGNDNTGVFITSVASNNIIGGATAGARNVVSGNDSNGVGIFSSNGNEVLGNRIGTTANGTGALGNSDDGVSVSGSNNFVGDLSPGAANTIAFNGHDGVVIAGDASIRNSILSNSVFSNAEQGIDLGDNGPTANDTKDPDTGANSLQNFPVITSAKTASTGTTVNGKLNSTPDRAFLVQYFSNPSGDEGKKLIGQHTIITNGNGNATFSFKPAAKVTVGQTITATATADDFTATADDTSEFSVPKTVVSATTLAPLDTTKLSGPSGITKNPTAHFKFTSPAPEATFECSLDGGGYYECSSPENINRLSEGRHVFVVRALDGEGTADPTPAEWVWLVDRNK